jgi:hypothetical protein
MNQKPTVEYRISDKEQQNFEGNPSILDILYSIFCGSKKESDNFPPLTGGIKGRVLIQND